MEIHLKPLTKFRGDFLIVQCGTKMIQVSLSIPGGCVPKKCKFANAKMRHYSLKSCTIPIKALVIRGFADSELRGQL
jgi:hypothetical protein